MHKKMNLSGRSFVGAAAMAVLATQVVAGSLHAQSAQMQTSQAPIPAPFRRMPWAR